MAFNPQKIYNRVKRSAKGLNVNSDEIFIKVITSVPTEGKVTTKELDKLIYEIAAAYTGSHHDYSRLASSVAISSYHKETSDSFCDTMKVLYGDGVVHEELMNKINQYGEENIDSIINHENDYNFDYFAWRSLYEMYLLKTPQGVTYPAQILRVTDGDTVVIAAPFLPAPTKVMIWVNSSPYLACHAIGACRRSSFNTLVPTFCMDFIIQKRQLLAMVLKTALYSSLERWR